MKIWDENRADFLILRDELLRINSNLTKGERTISKEMSNCWNTLNDLEGIFVDFSVGNKVLYFALLESFSSIIESNSNSELLLALNRYREFINNRIGEINSAEGEVAALIQRLRNQISASANTKATGGGQI
ncbi:MAG: hypothetical protein ACYC3P_04570 [Bellilinea sp.]